MTNSDIFDHLTVGGFTYAQCKNSWSKDVRKLLKAPIEHKHDLFIRKCLTAGRTEVMGSLDGTPIHIKDTPLQCVDVVSSYPNSCIAEGNMYPCGEIIEVEQQNSSKIGFYRVTIKQREDLPKVLPKRDFDDSSKPLDWKFKGRFETFCTTEDINVLREYNHEVAVHEGLEFQNVIAGKEIFSVIE